MTGKTYQRLFISKDEFLKLETVLFTFLVDVFHIDWVRLSLPK